MHRGAVTEIQEECGLSTAFLVKTNLVQSRQEWTPYDAVQAHFLYDAEGSCTMTHVLGGVEALNSSC